MNPQEYIQRQREEIQRQTNRRNTSTVDQSALDNTPSTAPPSYNQTMGYSDDDEERRVLLEEDLRNAGLPNLIPRLPGDSNTRISRHRSRRHRRHRHRHYRRSQSESKIEKNIRDRTPIECSFLACNLIGQIFSKIRRPIEYRKLSINSIIRYFNLLHFLFFCFSVEY